VQDRLDTKRMQSKCARVSLVFGAGDLFGLYSQLTPASGSTRWRVAPRQIRTTSSLRSFSRRLSFTNLSMAQKQMAPADAWADTTTAHGRLMLTVLGGLAEFERKLIKARTGEGRARAQARGVHVGRPPKLTAHQALRLNSAKVP
jgi:Resolvase, N terminal domain